MTQKRASSRWLLATALLILGAGLLGGCRGRGYYYHGEGHHDPGYDVDYDYIFDHGYHPGAHWHGCSGGWEDHPNRD